jgi:hypothetical protein
LTIIAIGGRLNGVVIPEPLGRNEELNKHVQRLRVQ